jgi:phosphatidylinositol-4,5-bisphosphate 3-kinase
MIDKHGHIFHIDFGHFLGNFKSFAGLKRERAPFVLTPEFAFVMGGKDSDRFRYFVRLCCRAYNLVRRNSNLIINLFAMMLSTGIPELRGDQDLLYLQDALASDLTDEESAQVFTELIYDSLSSLATRANFAIHILAH